MGLDQSMLSTSGEKDYYWRKHARLQVFMARKWEEKNGKQDDESALGHLGFNADDKPLVLDKEMLDEWENEIEAQYYHSFEKLLEQVIITVAHDCRSSSSQHGYRCRWL